MWNPTDILHPSSLHMPLSLNWFTVTSLCDKSHCHYHLLCRSVGHLLLLLLMLSLLLLCQDVFHGLGFSSSSLLYSAAVFCCCTGSSHQTKRITRRIVHHQLFCELYSTGAVQHLYCTWMRSEGQNTCCTTSNLCCCSNYSTTQQSTCTHLQYSES